VRPEGDPCHRVPGSGLAGRHRDLRQELTFSDRGHIDADEELLRRDRALAGRAPDRERRSECCEERRIVVGGVVHADVAAYGAAIANLDVRDRCSDFGENGTGHLDLGGGDHRRVGDHGADLERALIGGERDLAELVEIREIDEHIGRGGPGFHHVDERLAPCEGTCPIVLGEESDRLLDCGRTCVLDFS